MNEAQDLLERAERGTPRGPDMVWAAAQRRQRPTLLVSTALAAFVLLAVAALVLAVRSTGDAAPAVTTVPPPATLPMVVIDPAGGTTCTPDGFCAEVHGAAPNLRVRLTWQGAPVDSFDTDACSVESAGHALSISGGTTDADGTTTYNTWAGTAPLATEQASIPGVDVHQLKFTYQGIELHTFYAQSTDNIRDTLRAALMPNPDGWTPPADSACNARTGTPATGD